MKANVFHTHVLLSETTNRGRSEAQTISACVEGGEHVMFTVHVYFDADGVERGRNVVQDSIQVERCDSHDCVMAWTLFHRSQTDDTAREYSSAHSEDGASSTKRMCFGGKHFTFVFSKFEKAWLPDHVVRKCDGSCRKKEIKLPPSVARAVHAYRNSPASRWAA